MINDIKSRILTLKGTKVLETGTSLEGHTWIACVFPVCAKVQAKGLAST